MHDYHKLDIVESADIQSFDINETSLKQSHMIDLAIDKTVLSTRQPPAYLLRVHASVSDSNLVPNQASKRNISEEDC